MAASLFLWGQHYLIGIGEIDEQHEEIALLLNELHEQRRFAVSRRRLFEDLLQAVVGHFKAEEELMLKRGYAELHLHKLEHDAFLEKVLVMREDLDEGREVDWDGGLESVRDWLRNHLMTSDRRMGRALSQG